MGSVTVVGSYNLGITYRLEHLPVWGQTIAGKSAVFYHGGKGSNQAVAARRFGSEVSMVGAVGNDAAGRAARALWRGEGIDAKRVVTLADAATGVGSVFVGPSGQNAIVIGAGANGRLSPETIVRFKTRPWQGSDVVLAQMEVPLEAVKVAFAESSGIRIVNPAPAVPALAEERWDWVDILTPNETEARILAGLNADQEISDIALLRALSARVAVPSLVITRGHKGCLVWHQSRLWEVTALAVQAADTTGAGDVFNGILAASLAQGEPLLDAVARASTGASLSVRSTGVIEAIPDPDEVERYRSLVLVRERNLEEE